MIVLHECDDVYGEFHPGEPHRPVVVALGNRLLLDPKDPWRAWAQSHGAGFATIISRRPHAFPREPMEKVAAGLDAHAPDGVRLGLAASIAGHGMFKHAALLKLRHALAASALYSPDPTIIPDDMAIAKAVPSHGIERFAGSRADEFGVAAGVNCWSLYDPLDGNERAQSKALRDRAKVETISLHHLGHRTHLLLRDPPVISELFEAMEANDPMRATRALHAAKKSKFRYLLNLAVRCEAAGRLIWARALLERADKAGYTTASRGFDVAMGLHLKLDNEERVEQLLQRALARRLSRPQPYLFGARLRLRQGEPEAALHLCALGLKRCPGNAGLSACAEEILRRWPGLAG